MDNAQIAAAFSLLSRLMEIHGENSFSTVQRQRIQSSCYSISPSARRKFFL